MRLFEDESAFGFSLGKGSSWCVKDYFIATIVIEWEWSSEFVHISDDLPQKLENLAFVHTQRLLGSKLMTYDSQVFNKRYHQAYFSKTKRIII